MIKLKRGRLHPMSLSICYWLPQLSTCHFIKCCAVFVFFYPSGVLACVYEQDRGMPNGGKGPHGEKTIVFSSQTDRLYQILQMIKFGCCSQLNQYWYQCHKVRNLSQHNVDQDKEKSRYLQQQLL